MWTNLGGSHGDGQGRREESKREEKQVLHSTCGRVRSSPLTVRCSVRTYGFRSEVSSNERSGAAS